MRLGVLGNGTFSGAIGVSCGSAVGIDVGAGNGAAIGTDAGAAEGATVGMDVGSAEGGISGADVDEVWELVLVQQREWQSELRWEQM